MNKITHCADTFSGVVHLLYIFIIRPVAVLYAVVVLPIAVLCLSAFALTGMNSSSLNQKFSCDEDIVYGTQLSKDIRELSAAAPLLIELSETTDSDRIISQEEWRILQSEVDSRLEALRQECEEAEST